MLAWGGAGCGGAPPPQPADEVPLDSAVALPELPPAPDAGAPEEVVVAPGPCEGLSDGDPCDDGSACTVGDRCESGFCVPAGPLECAAPEKGAACLTVACDPAKGCVEQAAPAEAPCALPCYDAGRCVGGACVPVVGTARECPEPADPCVQSLACDPDTGTCTTKVYQLACPAGTLCGPSPEGPLACLATHTTQCQPCTEDMACAEEAFPSSQPLCVALGDNDGSFCASDCAGAPCPGGFVCELHQGSGAAVAKVCVPADGAMCTCDPAWAAMGLTTGCANINAFGACVGHRGCSPLGLSACDAPIPTAEMCDGLDNDCSGVADDGPDGACGALGACCRANDTCEIVHEVSCLATGGTFKGALLACDEVSCGSLKTGACCTSDGTCDDVTKVVCGQLGGQYQGDSHVCAETDCLAPPQKGACCFSNGQCSGATAIQCDDLGGAYQGHETQCFTAACPVLGACCLPDLSCVSVSQASCEAQGGAWQLGECGAMQCLLEAGHGACCFVGGSCTVVSDTQCASAGGQFLDSELCLGQCPAPDLGACCPAGGGCIGVSVSECGAGSTWQGVDTACPGACEGACCLSGGTCFVVSEGLCAGGGGVYLGSGSSCDAGCP